MSPEPMTPAPVTDFEVMDCALIAIATGRKAWTLKELRDALATVEASSVYHHFWGTLLAPRFREREYNNDFASWIRDQARVPSLAERLAIIDPTRFDDLEALRRDLLDIVDEHLDTRGYLPWLRASSAFHFVRSQLVVFETGRRVPDAAALGELVPDLSDGSVFYHVVDARRRTPGHTDDFRAWLQDTPGDHGDLCAALADVDPYFGTLAELREQLAAVFRDWRDTRS